MNYKMNYKKIITLTAFLSLFGILIGIFSFCQPDEKGICIGEYYNSAFSVWGGSLVIFVISIILFFLREGVFNSWKSFAIWWIPLSTFFILAAPSQDGSGLGFGFGIDRELVTWWMAGLFFLISIGVIVVKSLKLKSSLKSTPHEEMNLFKK